jgi:hypothetical protein
MRRAEGEGEMSDARQLDKMTATRCNRRTPEEDDPFIREKFTRERHIYTAHR